MVKQCMEQHTLGTGALNYSVQMMSPVKTINTLKALSDRTK
jgi:hypothetical protein